MANAIYLKYVTPFFQDKLIQLKTWFHSMTIECVLSSLSLVQTLKLINPINRGTATVERSRVLVAVREVRGSNPPLGNYLFSTINNFNLAKKFVTPAD